MSNPPGVTQDSIEEWLYTTLAEVTACIDKDSLCTDCRKQVEEAAQTITAYIENKVREAYKKGYTDGVLANPPSLARGIDLGGSDDHYVIHKGA